jgi:serine/threonine protein kinase
MSTEPDDSTGREEQLNQILHSYLQAVDAGKAPNQQDLVRQQPEFATELEAFFADQEKLEGVALLMKQIGGSGASPSQAVLGPARLAPGDQLGPYLLQALLGEGGMGQVFKAQDTLMNRTVAVKVISAHHARNPDALVRFRREMQALAQLDHPHVVRAFHADEDRGTLFLVMEYVEGITLVDLVRRRGPLPVAEACAYVARVAAALQHAHELGLVHRDIKPSNIMLETRGGIRLMDFGLAQLRDPASEVPDFTGPGRAFGTAEYMAPEQWVDSHQADIRSDLYSLGCTLYFLLAGRPPFPRSEYASDFQLGQAHLEAPAPSLDNLRPHVPPELEAVLSQLLAKDPAARYAAPSELQTALQPFVGTSDWVTPAHPAPKSVWMPSGWRWRLSAWGLAGSVATVLLLILAAWYIGVHFFHSIPHVPINQTSPLAIQEFTVRHYRGNPPVHRGELGDPSAFTTFAVADDDVKVHVILSKPAYFYLIAYLPNGKDALCFPKNPDEEPPLQTELIYPQEERNYFGLNDGIGLEAFVLLASEEPLPPYGQWQIHNQPIPWQDQRNVFITTEGVWVGDAEEIRLVCNENRGERERAGPPTTVDALHRFFKNQPGLAALRVVVFPVAEKK